MSQLTSARVLPPHPDLSQYRKQAKELVRAYAAGDPSALERVARFHPRFSSAQPATITLADAQLVIAREHGELSWPRFKTQLETANLSKAELADSLVRTAVTGRIDQILAILAQEPSLSGIDLYTASVTGDVAAARRHLASDPSLALKAGGVLNQQPLLYVAFSRLLWSPAHHDGIIEVARLLLDAGADPSASDRKEPFLDWPLSALYGAAGLHNDVQLTSLLLDYGANPNDNESLYHSVEHRGHQCTRILLDRGAVVNGTNALKHVLDRENLDGLRLLLDHGGDPNERNAAGETAQHWAVYRRRSPELLELLLQHGAEIDARRNDGLTAYRLAVRLGLGDQAEFLKRSGANDEIDESDRFLFAAWQGDRAGAMAMIAADPGLVERLSSDDRRMIVQAAHEGATETVAILLDAGVDIETRGEMNATAMHHAVWWSRPDMVRLLIERGAQLEPTGADLGTTPQQWALHASSNNPRGSEADFITIIKLLIEAGVAPPTDEEFSFASDEVRREVTDWLKTRAESVNQ